MGAIVPVESHLTALARHLARWQEGALSQASMVALVERHAAQMRKACRCAVPLCCPAHGVHTSPHMGCVLR